MIDNNLNTDDWKISILGNIVYSIGSGTTPKADKLDYYDNGTINWLLTGDLNDGIIKQTSNKITQEAFDNSSLKIYHSGNVVIAMYGATIGKLGILDIETTTNQACCSIDCGKKLSPKFLFYFLLNEKSFIISRALGGGQPNISQATVKNLFVRYPSYSEQQAIANYLDTKCCKIDALIATLKEMKDKYLSLKKSLINETVCRGLNKNVPLKSSGIDWIGDIPEHWEVKRFKDFFRDYTTGMTPDSKNENFFSFDGDNTWVSIADLNSRYVNKSSINLSDLAVKAFSPIKVFKGALMFSFKLSIGKIGFATKDLYTNEAIASLHANSHWDLNYLYYILPKILFGNANENIYGAKMLNQKTILQMLLIVPPISEQQSIAEYLDDKCSKIDSIVANIDSQIEAYTKLKKSLISEVVTGKKRVI